MISFEEFYDLNYDRLEEEVMCDYLELGEYPSDETIADYIYEQWESYIGEQEDLRYAQYKDDKLTGDL